MEYRIAITIAQRGVPDIAERNSGQLLAAFERTHPEAGAVIGATARPRSLEVTFSLAGDHVHDAFERAWRVFGDAVQLTKLPAGLTIERLEIVAVTSEFERPGPPT